MSDGRSRRRRPAAAWGFVRQMLDDMTAMVDEDAETELELLEGLRVLGRITALCSELSLDVDVESPWFFPMNSEARLIGGPNPDGEYQLAMISGAHRYRVRGVRGTSAYLGFQVLAGVGLTPRRMAAYVSDTRPAARRRRHLRARAGGRPSRRPPSSATALVGRGPRGRVGHRRARVHRRPRHRGALPSSPSSRSTRSALPPLPDDAGRGPAAHRHGLDDRQARHPPPHHQARAARPAQPAAHRRGRRPRRRRHHARQPLHDRHVPPRRGRGARRSTSPRPTPATGRVTLENIWHECIDHRRRRSSLTNAQRRPTRPTAPSASSSRATDPGHPNWLDTGHRHRGFVLLRWLDNPAAARGHRPRRTPRLSAGRHRLPPTARRGDHVGHRSR